MRKLNQKQRFIIITILVLALIGVSYYVYSKDNKEAEEELEISKEETVEKQEEKTIKVHIAGAVNKEGIVELKENSRIADAIEKAGGLKENAYVTAINLAYSLEDGEKIYIPTKEEQKLLEGQANVENIKEEIENNKNNSSNLGSTSINTGSSSSLIGATNNIGNSSKKNGKININKASEEQLDEIPGIGPATAQKIIEYRNQNGKFKTIEEIKDVKGIGESKFEKMKEHISV